MGTLLRRGEVYWVAFDPSVGGEIQKTRPAVIVSNDAANQALNRVLVIPISSKIERVYPGEALVDLRGKQGKAMADQLTAASKLRIKGKLGALSSADMAKVDAVLRLQLGIA